MADYETWWASDARRPNGGPAFAHGNPEHGGDPGMSLRDWFAGQALAGIIANSNTPDQMIGLGFTGSKELLANYAYAAADAMLAARNTAPEGKSDG